MNIIESAHLFKLEKRGHSQRHRVAVNFSSIGPKRMCVVGVFISVCIYMCICMYVCNHPTIYGSLFMFLYLKLLLAV